MTFLSDREHILTGIEQATWRAKCGFMNCAELEDEKAVIKALVIDTIRAIRQLVDTATEDYTDAKSLSYLDGIENAVNDDVDNQFSDAINKRDDERDDERDDRPASRRAPYGIVYDHSRA